MATETLVGADIELGAELIRRLDRADFGVHAALWLFRTEEEQWRLMIATPRFDEEGPKRAYRRLQRVLRTSKPSLELSLLQIGLVSPEDPLIKTLGLAVKTGDGISQIRFSRNTINGVYIPDALIYRVK
ncbi:MAG: hypothetical protein JW809_17480 [Pirellulales bacterium]|nr:hypothetical protein [Pirellulales bacterium]